MASLGFGKEIEMPGFSPTLKFQGRMYHAIGPLKPEDGHKTICPYRAIKTFDDILVNLVGEESMQRFLICPNCILEGKEKA